MGGGQNYGPFLCTLNIRCRIIIGSQKGTIILTTTHMICLRPSAHQRGWGNPKPILKDSIMLCCSFRPSHCTTLAVLCQPSREPASKVPFEPEACVSRSLNSLRVVIYVGDNTEEITTGAMKGNTRSLEPTCNFEVPSLMCTQNPAP